jgi:hypothetical protein
VHTRILKFGLITSYQIISPEAKFKSCLGFTQISCDVYTRTSIIINGDLNVDLLRENNNKLLEIISEFNLTNVIKEPTRTGALLDPILVSNLDIAGIVPIGIPIFHYLFY